MDIVHNSPMMNEVGVQRRWWSSLTDFSFVSKTYVIQMKNKNSNCGLSLPKQTVYRHLNNMYGHNYNVKQNLKIRAAIYANS